MENEEGENWEHYEGIEREVLDDIARMEQENLDEKLRLELEEVYGTDSESGDRRSDENLLLLEELWRIPDGSEEMNLEGPILAIQSEDVEQKKGGFEKLIKVCEEDISQISRNKFDVILELLLLSLDEQSGFEEQCLTLLSSILFLARSSELQLTEEQLRLLMPRIDILLMKPESKRERVKLLSDVLARIMVSHFPLLGKFKKLTAEILARSLKELDLFGKIFQTVEKIIRTDQFDHKDAKVIKGRDMLLSYLIILGTVEDFSASVVEKILHPFEKIDSSEFAKCWEKLSIGHFDDVQLLVVKTLLASLCYFQLHNANGKFISEIVVQSGANIFWEELVHDLKNMLGEKDNTKVTGALVAVKNISVACRRTGLVDFKRHIDAFFQEFFGWLDKMLLLGKAIIQMIWCRTDYVLNRKARAILIRKLEKKRNEPMALTAITVLINAEDKRKFKKICSSSNEKRI